MATAETDLEQHADEIGELRGQMSMLDEYLSVGTIVSTGGTAAAPSLITTDSWNDTGALATGWSKTGYFKYTLLPDGWVGVAAKLTSDGTNNGDGTTILVAANGLPSAYRPATNKLMPAYCNSQKIASGSNNESAGLSFITDGSVQCFGIAATSGTSIILHASFPIAF